MSWQLVGVAIDGVLVVWVRTASVVSLRTTFRDVIPSSSALYTVYPA